MRTYKKGSCMHEHKVPGIIENSAVARILPLKTSLLTIQIQNETTTVKSEFPDDDVRNLVGEVYAG